MNYRYVLLCVILSLTGVGHYQGMLSLKQRLLIPLLCAVSAILCLNKSPMRDRGMGLLFAALAYILFKTHQMYAAIPYFVLSVVFTLYPEKKTVEFELM